MPRPRSPFIDRLRVVLTALVIVHHTAITDGGSGSGLRREVTDAATPSSLLLSAFCAVNQSFFMGLFFLLAGDFTPAALARKGGRGFLLGRLLRLGVPLLLSAAGFVAWRHRWLGRVGAREARLWGRVSLAAPPALFVTVALAGALQGRQVDVTGGWGLPAIVDAFREPLVAWGIVARLLHRFRARFDRPDAAWQRWGTQADGAFIVHAPVLVALSVLRADWQAQALLKFALVGTGSTVASFAVAAARRRAPGARRFV